MIPMLTTDKRKERRIQSDGQPNYTHDDIVQACLTDPNDMKLMISDWLSDDLVGALLLLMKRKDRDTTSILYACECVIKSLEDMAKKQADHVCRGE